MLPRPNLIQAATDADDIDALAVEESLSEMNKARDRVDALSRAVFVHASSKMHPVQLIVMDSRDRVYRMVYRPGKTK